MTTSDYADHLGIDPQAEGESDLDFRRRVAVTLRERGMIIEAAEVLAGDVRWEAPDQDPATGPYAALMGHAALALNPMQGAEHRDTLGQMEDEQIAGALLNAPPDPGEEALRKMFELLGPEATMDLLGGKE